MHHQNGDAQLPIADGLLVTLLAVLLQFIGTIMMPESVRLERQEDEIPCMYCTYCNTAVINRSVDSMTYPMITLHQAKPKEPVTTLLCTWWHVTTWPPSWLRSKSECAVQDRGEQHC
ncbi:hypothetical protein LIA77_07565 [Sarocladium implicatum]|nr:hypothetical protein LIA77_07565 [Sarocladium implicatum]